MVEGMKSGERHTSLAGSRYFITFIDDFSKRTTTSTMLNMSDSFECFKMFHKIRRDAYWIQTPAPSSLKIHL